MPEMTREGWESLNQRYAELTVTAERMRNAIVEYMQARAMGDIERLEGIHDAFSAILVEQGVRLRRPDRPAGGR